MNEKKECPYCLGSGTDFGTDNNKITVLMPKHWDTKRDSRLIDIDSCLVPEINHLWKIGIRTIECCCGHGVASGYISVSSRKDISMMEQLGYDHHKENKRKGFFIPKHNRNNS